MSLFPTGLGKEDDFKIPDWVGATPEKAVPSLTRSAETELGMLKDSVERLAKIANPTGDSSVKAKTEAKASLANLRTNLQTLIENLDKTLSR